MSAEVSHGNVLGRFCNRRRTLGPRRLRFGPFLLLTACLVVLAAIDLLAGDGFSVPSGVILWKLRVPRMLTAVLGGGSLALAGAQMQALFRNPLADPHIMGVSGGAGLGAALAAIAIGTSGVSMVSAAFIGAFLTGLLIVWVSSRIHSTGTLLLVGVMLGFIFSAISSVLQYRAGEESLKLLYSWMAGSFQGVGPVGVAVIGGAFVIGLVCAICSMKGLDLMLFGESYAGSAGVPLRRLRFVVMIGCAIMTGAVTAYCGPLGFVGIAAPHIVRKIMGTSAHKTVLPLSPVAGACLALVADIIAHLGSSPLPVGSTLALVGIPLVIILLWKNRL